MKDLALNGNRTGETVAFFCNPALIWRPKPPLFFGEFSQKFPERCLCTCRGPKTDFAFWRYFAPKKKQRCAGVKILGEKIIQHQDTGMVKVI
jgi:hypothetical protein